MSVAPYPLVSDRSPRRRRNSTRRRNSQENPRRTKLVQPPRQRQATVEVLPEPSAKLPPQLKLMLRLQQATSAISIGLVVATLGVYGWTVYVPKMWSQAYKDLETLQRHERHLTATNESIKNQLALQAEKPESGLANPHPAQSIFLPSTPVKSIAVPAKEDKKNSQAHLSSDPVAY